ncbi:hypothetical protein [Halomicrococcus sp. SG-WS-1]|uniref:hypothetical protein n=1 Tax=Halomicrococcus sp. SG-WS-1 TaxID=3439057 RepID=UPI003F7A73AD
MPNRLVENLGLTNLDSYERHTHIESIKNLIGNLDTTHPDILEAHDIDPDLYDRDFGTAVNSIGGFGREAHGRQSEEWVKENVLRPGEEAGLLTFRDNRDNSRIDFEAVLELTSQEVAWEVKGGEGESHSHLDVPEDRDYDLILVWSDLQSQKAEPPERRIKEIVRRDIRTGVNERRDSDNDIHFSVLRDPIAGAELDGEHIPITTLHPVEYPHFGNVDPDLPDLNDIPLIETIYRVLLGRDDLTEDVIKKQIWFHDLRLVDISDEDDDRTDLWVRKNYYNAYDNDIQLRSQRIEYYNDRDGDPHQKSELDDDLLNRLRRH